MKGPPDWLTRFWLFYMTMIAMMVFVIGMFCPGDLLKVPLFQWALIIAGASTLVMGWWYCRGPEKPRHPAA
jgi:hypothetical protein